MKYLLIALLIFSLIVSSIPLVSPVRAAINTETLTKTITYDYSCSESFFSLSAELSLNYEFLITYEDSVLVNDLTTINISASDVDVDFTLDVSFDWDIALVEISGSLHLTLDTTLELGYNIKNPFTANGVFTINIDTIFSSDTASVSFSITGYITTLLNIINGLVSINGTSIPPEQWINENVTWTSDENIFSVNLQPTSPGTINLDIIDPAIFIVPAGLYVEDLTIYDVPGIGDVTIPINYGLGASISKFYSSAGEYYIREEAESYSLGCFSADIKVMTWLEANILWITFLILVIIVVAVVAFLKLRKH